MNYIYSCCIFIDNCLDLCCPSSSNADVEAVDEESKNRTRIESTSFYESSHSEQESQTNTNTLGTNTVPGLVPSPAEVDPTLTASPYLVREHNHHASVSIARPPSHQPTLRCITVEPPNCLTDRNKKITQLGELIFDYIGEERNPCRIYLLTIERRTREITEPDYGKYFEIFNNFQILSKVFFGEPTHFNFCIVNRINSVDQHANGTSFNSLANNSEGLQLIEQAINENKNFQMREKNDTSDFHQIEVDELIYSRKLCLEFLINNKMLGFETTRFIYTSVP